MDFIGVYLKQFFSTSREQISLYQKSLFLNIGIALYIDTIDEVGYIESFWNNLEFNYPVSDIFRDTNVLIAKLICVFLFVFYIGLWFKKTRGVSALSFLFLLIYSLISGAEHIYNFHYYMSFGLITVFIYECFPKYFSGRIFIQIAKIHILSILIAAAISRLTSSSYSEGATVYNDIRRLIFFPHLRYLFEVIPNLSILVAWGTNLLEILFIYFFIRGKYWLGLFVPFVFFVFLSLSIGLIVPTFTFFSAWYALSSSEPRKKLERLIRGGKKKTGFVIVFSIGIIFIISRFVFPVYQNLYLKLSYGSLLFYTLLFYPRLTVEVSLESLSTAKRTIGERIIFIILFAGLIYYLSWPYRSTSYFSRRSAYTMYTGRSYVHDGQILLRLEVHSNARKALLAIDNAWSSYSRIWSHYSTTRKIVSEDQNSRTVLIVKAIWADVVIDEACSRLRFIKDPKELTAYLSHSKESIAAGEYPSQFEYRIPQICNYSRRELRDIIMKQREEVK